MVSFESYLKDSQNSPKKYTRLCFKLVFFFEEFNDIIISIVELINIPIIITNNYF